MRRQLRVGDVFRVRRIKPALHFVFERKFVDEKLTRVEEQVTLDYTDRITWFETQRRPGGWQRTIERTLDISAPWAIGATWRVVSARMGGGGTGMGPHDVYPDGLYVEAENLAEPKQRLTFYQSGAFIPEIMPEDIDLVEEK